MGAFGITRRLGGILAIITVANSLVLSIMAVMIALDVAVRWLIGRPITGVYEISEVLLLAISFMAFAQVQYSSKQLRVDIVSSMARGRLATALRILDQLAAFVFFSIVLYVAWGHWIEAVRRGYRGRGLIEIPTAIPLGILLAGTVLMLATLAVLLIVTVIDLAYGRNQGTVTESDASHWNEANL